MRNVLVTAALVFSACTMAQTPEFTKGASVNGWRGPQNNGNYPDKGLLNEWPAEGPQKIFEVEDAGKGYSSAQVVGDRIYLTGLNDQEDKEILNCYKLDGTKVYSVEYGNRWQGSFPETRTTASYSDGRLYVISGSGEIVALNAEDGKILWTVNGGEKYGRKTGMWGTSECPLVYDDKVIYTPCGDQATIVALNKFTGEEMWKSASLGDKGCYVSPILITYKGKRQIIGSTANKVYGANPETGEIEWTFDDWGPKHYGTPKRGDNIATNSPLYHDGKIFLCHGYDLNGFQLQLADDLKSVSVVWRTETLDTHHGGYVLVGNNIYGSNWLNNNAGNWCCIDWNTGETKYETPWEGKGKGSIISADGKLICYDERHGTVGLVKATPDGFNVVSEFRMTKGSGPYWAHPTISKGILYVRHAEAFCAYKI